MLKKQYRLPLSAKTFLKNSVSSPLFTVRYYANNLPQSRFAFIVSKKIDKTAVGRNKLKRIFRTCIQNQLTEIISGNDILLIVRAGAKGKSVEEIALELKNIFKKTHLLHE